LKNRLLTGKSVLPFCLLFSVIQLMCSLPETSLSDLTGVSFKQVWFNGKLDQDQDGFYSQGTFSFIPHLDHGEHRLLFSLYYRSINAAAGTEPELYSEIGPILINAQNGEDTLTFALDGSGHDLPQNHYTFFIRAFDPQASDFILAEAKPPLLPSLSDVGLETDETDARLKINRVIGVNLKDYDADGYASNLSGAADLSCSRPGRMADLIIQAVSAGSGIASPVDTIFNLVFTDTILTYPFDTFLRQLTANHYDLQFLIRFAGRELIEDRMDAHREPTLGNLLLESFGEEMGRQVVLSHLDEEPFQGSEKYQDGSLDRSDFAVRFDQPQAAVMSRIKTIRIHVSGDENYVILKLWSETAGLPSHEISLPASQRYLKNNQWNVIQVDVDVAEFHSFFVGYRQTSIAGPSISLDLHPPHSRRSFRRDPFSGSWLVIPDADLAIEVVLEYFTDN